MKTVNDKIKKFKGGRSAGSTCFIIGICNAAILYDTFTASICKAKYGNENKI